MVQERQTVLTRIEQQLRMPRPERPDIGKLRDALNKRAEEWRKTLREEPKVARVLLRRIVGPLTMWDPDDHAAFVEWETSVTPAILEGLAPPIQVDSSPRGPGRLYTLRGATQRLAA